MGMGMEAGAGAGAGAAGGSTVRACATSARKVRTASRRTRHQDVVATHRHRTCIGISIGIGCCSTHAPEQHPQAWRYSPTSTTLQRHYHPSKAASPIHCMMKCFAWSWPTGCPTLQDSPEPCTIWAANQPGTRSRRAWTTRSETPWPLSAF